MPYLDVVISTLPDASVSGRIAELLTRLSANILRKKREVTAVAVRHVPPGHWFINGAVVGADMRPQAASFYLEIRITAGTNTPEEKARFVAQAFSGMQEILGTLAPASYVAIHEIGADSWGYQGRTQQDRLLSGRSP